MDRSQPVPTEIKEPQPAIPKGRNWKEGLKLSAESININQI